VVLTIKNIISEAAILLFILSPSIVNFLIM